MYHNLVIFGGYSQYGDCENDLAVLDMITWRWSVPKVSGEAPAPRMSHTATRFGSTMLVYGGYAGDATYLSDVHVLDTESWAWSAPKVPSSAPP